MREIAVVICNFNKKDYLRQCLNSLFASDINRDSYDVIVVDNASEDGAPEMVKKEFNDDVLLLENKINSGGSGGFARGINHAISKNYKYLVLLDNDIKLEPNTISELKKHIDHYSDVAIVGSKICTMDHPDILQELGSFIDYEKFHIKTPFKGHTDSSNLPSVVECDYVPACCLIAKMDVVKKIGAFDIDHFIYWDDMDWCIKAKEAGFKVHAISSSKVFHKMGAANNTNTFSLYYFERNRILFFLKHLDNKEIPTFVDKISEELINLTFFSNNKQKYNSAISQLLGLNDLDRGILGRCDEHILPKEEICPFEKLSTQKDDDIFFIPLSDIHMNRVIYNNLKKFFSKDPVLCINLSDSKLYKEEFADAQIISYGALEVKENTIVFHGIDHIINAPRLNDLSKNHIFIDSYLNMVPATDINVFLTSYDTYRSIFLNIFKPVLEDQFRSIYKKLHTT